ncbi:hypothetical protein [Actinokineospora bangkokensis]|uniref:Uncharacterized protein n=1 Tax=Actinokineospora bangkokensis TaxID=1193682 RepID=A0A1Q9LI97_9PSEU|nr:hypothetical protein [Actinokineospora bangkokensis]OLR91743.1 hypothetical protein BJP25_24750 [Actinokineospora bangkokensis]
MSDTPGAVRIYHPWPAPVRAVPYDDPSDLWQMRRWVESQRAAGKTGARFTVDWREDTAVGVLHDDGGLIAEVRPSDFLVRTDRDWRVMGAGAFWRTYREATA